MLEKAVGTLRKRPLKSWLDVTIELPCRSYLPRDFVPGLRQKIEVYRKLARLRELDDVRGFLRELEDRFGRLPEPAANLLHLAELRILAEQWQIEVIRLEENYVMFGYRNPEAIQRLARQSKGRLRVADTTSAYLPLNARGQDLAELLPQIKTLLQQK